MSFEWLSTDDAARTLGVEVATLNQWIESGRAPSRKQNNRTEVLIEFDEEDVADPTRPTDGTASATTGTSADSPTDSDNIRVETFEQVDEPHAQEPPSTKSDSPDPAYQQMQLVHQRELQMAGGMVAAWQRLAETADQELSRTRRLNTAGWSTVAVLALAIIGGIVWAVTSIERTQSRLNLTESDLTRTSSDLETARQQQTTQNAALQRESAEAEQLRELLEAERLERARNEAALAETKTRAELLEAANALLRTDSANIAETNKSAIEAVRNVNDQLIEQNKTLRAEVDRITATPAADESETGAAADAPNADAPETQAAPDAQTPRAAGQSDASATTPPTAQADPGSAEKSATQPLISTTRQDVPPENESAVAER